MKFFASWRYNLSPPRRLPPGAPTCLAVPTRPESSIINREIAYLYISLPSCLDDDCDGTKQPRRKLKHKNNTYISENEIEIRMDVPILLD